MRAGGIKIEMESLLCKMSWKGGRGRGTKRPRGRTSVVMKDPPSPFLSLSLSLSLYCKVWPLWKCVCEREAECVCALSVTLRGQTLTWQLLKRRWCASLMFSSVLRLRSHFGALCQTNNCFFFSRSLTDTLYVRVTGAEITFLIGSPCFHSRSQVDLGEEIFIKGCCWLPFSSVFYMHTHACARAHAHTHTHTHTHTFCLSTSIL